MMQRENLSHDLSVRTRAVHEELLGGTSVCHFATAAAQARKIAYVDVPEEDSFQAVLDGVDLFLTLGERSSLALVLPNDLKTHNEAADVAWDVYAMLFTATLHRSGEPTPPKELLEIVKAELEPCKSRDSQVVPHPPLHNQPLMSIVTSPHYPEQQGGKVHPKFRLKTSD